jgi:hypothetical protein
MEEHQAKPQDMRKKEKSKEITDQKNHGDVCPS